MNILVTGGAGFIGSRLIERCSDMNPRGSTCLDNYNDYYSPQLKRENVQAFAAHPHVRMIEGSFTDAGAMRSLFQSHQFEYVVQLGGYAGVRYSVENPFPYEQHNVGGTLALLEAARHEPVRRFLLASSSTVYGRAMAAAPFQEDAHLGTPLTPTEPASARRRVDGADLSRLVPRTRRLHSAV